MKKHFPVIFYRGRDHQRQGPQCDQQKGAGNAKQESPKGWRKKNVFFKAAAEFLAEKKDQPEKDMIE